MEHIAHIHLTILTTQCSSISQPFDIAQTHWNLLEKDHFVRCSNESVLFCYFYFCTSCESNYSNIERELLGVLFSVLHFKHFTYGHKVHIITDHKPLVSLFRKSLTSASPRLSRSCYAS